MNIYVDKEGLKDFLSCIYEGKKELRALGKFIKGNCQVVLLPEKKREVPKKNPGWDEKLFAEVNGSEYADKNDKERGNIASLYYRLLGIEDKKDERFLELLDLWVRDAEILPYENRSQGIDDNFSDFTSVLFSKDRQGVSSDVLRPNLPIKDFLEKLLIKNDPNPSRVLDSKTDKLEWKDLLGEALPVSEVIIVDPYFLQEKDTSSSKKLLRQILSSSSNAVNIIVFCNCFDKIEHDKEKEYIIKFKQIKDIYEEVKENGKHKITFISPIGKKNKLHDRYVITNYKFYLSGHSFSQMFSEEQQDITEDRTKNVALGSTWFVANNYIDIQNHEVVSSIIKRLKDIKKGTSFRHGDATSKLLDLTDVQIIDIKYIDSKGIQVEKDAKGRYHCGKCLLNKYKKRIELECKANIKLNKIKFNTNKYSRSEYYLYCDDFEIIPEN